MKITAEFNSNEELLSFISTFGTKANIVEAGVQEIEEITPKPITKQHEEKSTPEPVEKQQKSKVETSKDENKTEDKPEANVDKAPDPVEKVTKEMVRASFAKLIKSGKQKEAKELTKKYGANRLPDIKEEDFEAIYKEAEGLI